MGSDDSTVATADLDYVIAENNGPSVDGPDDASNVGPPPFAAGLLDANEISNMGPPHESDDETWSLDDDSTDGSLSDCPPAADIDSVADSRLSASDGDDEILNESSTDGSSESGDESQGGDVSSDWAPISEIQFNSALLEPNIDFNDGSGVDDEVGNDLCAMISSFEISDGVKVAPNKYIDDLAATSGLHLRHPRRIIALVQDENADMAELNLFKLFFPRSLLKTIAKWTTARLDAKGRGHKRVGETELNAYVGLEIGMALKGGSTMSECWSNVSFSGGDNLFNRTMSRDRFSVIRGSLAIRDPTKFNVELSQNDPLWHCRGLLEQMAARCAKIAVPVGVTTLDECGYRSKARSRAISYLPSKPDKYAIRFYAIVCWKTLYLHSFEHNGTGVNLRLKAVERYIERFPTMKGAYSRVFTGTGLAKRFGIDKLSSTALWTMMLFLQEHLCRSNGNHKRVMFCDNFYTRHSFASVLKEISDGTIRMVGTVRGNFIGKDNSKSVKLAMQRLSDKRRGSWELVRAHDPPLTRDGATLPAECAGFIVFKDSKVCVFYSNDLAFTPSQDFLTSESQEAIGCCHGLATVERWLGTENGHRSQLKVPAPVVAYNIYMNSVDRMDQKRSTNPTRRKEKRLPMTLFTAMLDVAINNAFAIYEVLLRKKYVKKEMQLKDFKRKVALGLINPQLRQREKAQAERDLRRNAREARHNEATERRARERAAAIGALHDGCYLVETAKAGSNCYLCYKLGLIEGESNEQKIRTGCPQCQKCFHPNCFTAYHHQGAVGASGNAELAGRLARLSEQVDFWGNPISTTNKPVTGFPSLANLEIPKTSKAAGHARRSRAEMAAARAGEQNAANDGDNDDTGENQPRRQRQRRA